MVDYSKRKLILKSFGVLSSVRFDSDGNLFISNASGNQVQMVFSKWQRQIPQVHKKCIELIGCDVCIVTSQTTALWSTDDYFCDIKPNQINGEWL